MRIKPKALTDAQLLSACRAQAEAGSAFVDSQLALERREVTDYYLGKRPTPLRDGGSKFVSQDVYLSVEAMKAEIVETFGAGSQIVAFNPQGDDDVPLAKQATAYCEYVVFRQNTGISLFQDVVHDGLTNRVGIAKVYWDPREESEDFVFRDATQAEAAKLIQDPQVRLKAKPTVKLGQNGEPLVSGEFERVTDTSQVVIEPVPPEEFIIRGRAPTLDKVRYCAHRYRTTRGDLVADGHDPDLVYSITGGDDELALDEEKMAREQDTTTYWTSDDDAVDEAGQMLTVYESYIRIDAEGSGRQQLWKVVHAGDTLLDKQKVSSHPFVTYVPQPIPHTFFGNNFAARTIQHANTKTTLTRAIIEQAVEATNPRWQIARGGVPNPRELLDNRRGGVVNVRSVSDSIAPLPQASINPFVLQTIAMVDSDREDTTSISRLSQGLDKKALSHQNSAGLVEQLTSNSQTRTKIIARQFAHQFVSLLYLKVYQLVIANESREKIIDIAGSFTACDPTKWAARREVDVDMTLGYGERDKRVQELLVLDERLSRPGYERMYGEAQRYSVMKEAMEIKGYKNIGRFMVDPASLPPPEPNEREVAEVAEIKSRTALAERAQELREQQIASEVSRKDAELQLKITSHSEEMDLKRAEQERKRAETENRIDIGLAELELAVEAQLNATPENVKLTAIASPNS